jgi:hypothetical protein
LSDRFGDILIGITQVVYSKTAIIRRNSEILAGEPGLRRISLKFSPICRVAPEHPAQMVGGAWLWDGNIVGLRWLDAHQDKAMERFN